MVNFFNLINTYTNSFIENNEIHYIETSYSKDIVIEKMHSILNESLAEYSCNVIMTEFNEFNNYNGKSKISNGNLIEFENLMRKDKLITLINERFPELERIIKVRLKFLVEYTNKIFNDLEDFKALQPFKALNYIEFGIGDSHNNGKSVCKIKLDNKEYIYKPRSCYLDQRFNKFVGQYIENYGFNQYSFDDFSIHEIVESNHPKTEDEIKKYYYNIGILSAMMYFFSATDMHYENLIISGTKPIFIDLETLVDVIDVRIESSVKTFFEVLSNSVLRTMIYPCYINNVDMEISALTGEESVLENFHYKVYELVDIDKDTVRYEESNPRISECKNIIYFNGKKVHAIEYISELKKGFEIFSLNVIENKEKILNEMIEVIGDSEIRQILRPTHVYCKYLSTSYEAYYLQDENYRNELLNILYEKNSNEKEININKLYRQAEYEKKYLLNGDVPIFFARLNDKNLYGNEEIIIEDFFEEKPLEKIKRKITKFSLKDMKRELSLIETSLLISGYNNNFKESQKNNIKTLDIDINTKLKEIISKFMDILVQNEDMVIGLIPTFTGTEFLLSGLNSAIYESGGYILMLAYLRKDLNISNETLINIMQSIKELELDSSDKLCGFFGIGSSIYLNYLIGKETGESYFYNELKKYLNMLSEDIFNIESIDFTGGVSGIATILSNIYLDNNCLGVDEHKLIYNELVKYKNYIMNNIDKMQLGAGLAHGYSGIILALASMNSILMEKDISDKINSLLNKEEESYNEEFNNYLDLRDKSFDKYYFCYGLPGILQVRIRLYELGYKELKSDIERKLMILINDISSRNIDIENMSYSLCHGTGSIIDVLEDSFRNKLINRETYKEVFFKLINAGCKNNKNGIDNRTKLIGFMLGEGGIAYNILRYKNNNIPCMLTLSIK